MESSQSRCSKILLVFQRIRADCDNKTSLWEEFFVRDNLYETISNFHFESRESGVFVITGEVNTSTNGTSKIITLILGSLNWGKL